MKKKIEKHVNILVPCKKCSQHFWPFYNFAETKELEEYCLGCKNKEKKREEKKMNLDLGLEKGRML